MPVGKKAIRMKHLSKTQGAILGIVAAISYGTNPLGGLFLYEEGLNTSSVIFYRYLFAALMLGAWMVVRRTPFGVTRRELSVTAALGLLFALSSLTLFGSFHHMDAGLACTVLFVYPVMVAVMMTLFFGERASIVTTTSIALALSGIFLLYQGDGAGGMSSWGMLLVMISALTYALYIILVNRSGIALPPEKLTFYVLLFGLATLCFHAAFAPAARVMPLTTPAMWGWTLMLALIPTVISLVTMTLAVHSIGSTPTAVLGALEPLTAVVIGVTIFGEAFTPRLAVGIVLILFAVLLIIGGDRLHPRHLLRRLHTDR